MQTADRNQQPPPRELNYMMKRAHRTAFSSHAAKAAPVLRPLIDSFHYAPLLRRLPARELPPGRADLPVNYDVPYRTLLSWSFPLAVLSASQDIAPLVANYYGSIFFPVAKVNGGKSMTCPHVLPAYTFDTLAGLGLMEEENHDLVAEDIDPVPAVRFCIESLLSGWYVSTNVNEYYVPGTTRYRKRDFRHPLLISGYTARPGIFSAVTYVNGTDFTRIALPLGLMGKAIVSRATFDRMSVPHYRGVVKRLRRCRPRQDFAFALNVRLVTGQMDDYLNSRMPPAEVTNPVKGVEEFDPARYPGGCVYGMDTYESLARYLQFVSGRPKECDLRVTRVFWEHKKLMAIRLKYLESIKAVDPLAGFLERYETVVTWACDLHLAIFDWAQRKSGPGRIRALCERLGEIRRREEHVLGGVLGMLR